MQWKADSIINTDICIIIIIIIIIVIIIIIYSTVTRRGRYPAAAISKSKTVLEVTAAGHSAPRGDPVGISQRHLVR